MKKPFFSVIIPTLNEEKYLPHLLSDLSKQSYRDFEVIIADGQSDDSTVSLAKKKTKDLPSLTIVKSKTRHVCIQRNLGADVANADWLIFMDADIRIPEYFLLGLRYRLDQSQPDIATVFSESESNKRSDKAFITSINIAVEAAANIRLPIIQEALVVIRKTLFKKVGGFDANVHYIEGRKLLEDVYAQSGVYKVFHDPIYKYSFRRVHKYGKIHLVNSLVAHELSRMLGIQLTPSQIALLYPMDGGNAFDVKRKKRSNPFVFLRKLLSP